LIASLGDQSKGTLLAKIGAVTPKPDTGAVVVPAGGEFFVKANIYKGREGSCSVTTAFTPKPGGHYEVIYLFSPRTAPMCSATVVDIDPSKPKAALEQTASTKYGC
jgi:hypothetical protein